MGEATACDCAKCRTNPDSSRFEMSVFHGLKHVTEPNAPNVSVPMCLRHGRWPCPECGTKHCEECDCGYCDPEPKAKQPALSETDLLREKLREARKWMEHARHCQKNSRMPTLDGQWYTMADFDKWRAEQPCTCGLDDFLKGAPAP